jgi:hypothetical protein
MKIITALSILIAGIIPAFSADNLEDLARKVGEAFEAYDAQKLDKLRYSKDQPKQLSEYEASLNKLNIQEFRDTMVKLGEIEFGKSTGYTPDMVLPRQSGGDNAGQPILFGKRVAFMVPPTDMIVVEYPKGGGVDIEIAFPVARIGEQWYLIGLGYEKSEQGAAPKP